MKKIAAAAGLTAGLMFAASANAADLHLSADSKYAPVYAEDWAGLYAGVAGGGLYHHAELTGTSELLTEKIYFGAPSAFGSFNIGYNVQRGPAVLGVEADYGFADALTGEVLSGIPGGIHERLTWLGTVRGRLGYSFGNSLVYGTGGFAYGRVKHWVYLQADQQQVVSYNISGTQTGWTAGAGFEQALGGNLALTGQFLYANLGTTSLPDWGGEGSMKAENEAFLATIGLKYRFGGASLSPLK